MTIGHNQGPPLGGLSLDEAQELADVRLRPSYVQRYAGPGSPLRSIVAVRSGDSFGRWVSLSCGHMRAIRDWDLMPVMGRKRPSAARCGCCRLGYGVE
jgi:hypothetical protein